MASKQKLSPAAKKRKAARDLAFAKTPARRAKKAHAQRERRKAKRKGVNVNGKIGITRMEDGKVLLETVQMMEKGLNVRVKKGTRYQNVKNKYYD